MPAVQTARPTAVQWQDLRQLTRLEVLHELLLSPPWLVASWCAASFDHYVIALGCSFMFFVTGLRQVHNAYHYALGLSRQQLRTKEKRLREGLRDHLARLGLQKSQPVFHLDKRPQLRLRG